MQKSARILTSLLLATLCTWTAHAFKVDGVVLGPDNSPIPDARIWLTQGQEVQQTRSGTKGGFHFSGVNVGELVLVAWQDGYAAGGVSVQIVGDAEVSIYLAEPEPLRIRAIDTTYTPVEGVRFKSVLVNGSFHIPMQLLSNHGFPSYRSDAEGQLALPIMPKEGFARFTLYHRRYAQRFVPYLGAGRDEPLSIVLRKGVLARGRVLTPGGAGLEGADVAIFSRTPSGPRQEADAVTGPDGFFSTRIQPGSYYVAAHHPEYATSTPRGIELTGDGADEPVQVTMHQPHFVHGKVVLDDGNPVGGVNLAYLLDKTIHATTLTRNNGRFEMMVAPGEGKVRVFPPQGLMKKSPIGDVLVSFSETERADVGELELEPLPLLEGTILDTSGDPVPRALVYSEQLGKPIWAITNDSGRFRIQLEWMPSEPEAVLHAEHPRNLSNGTVTYDLHDPEPREVVLEPYKPDLNPVRPGAQYLNDLARLLDEEAPELQTSAWINSDPLTLEELRGKVVAILFWGGFAQYGPMRDRMEQFRAIHQILGDAEDVVLIGFHDSASLEEEIREYVQEYQLDFPVARDHEPGATFDAYDIRFIPQTVLIDKEGKLQYFDVEGRLFQLIKSLRR